MMEVLAIIPARGGSKGIKKKNLVKVKGKTLIEYSIEHALSSKYITKTIVSSENEEILTLARGFKEVIPLQRPQKLAEDHVLDLPVFEHALEYLKLNENYVPDIIVHLRPTAPFRRVEWIDEAIEKLIETPEAESIRSVSEPEKHPYRIFDIDENGYLNSIMKHKHEQSFVLRRQDLPKMYYYNCVIDVTRWSTIMELKSMTGNKMLPFIMDPDEVIDIDTPKDLFILNQLFMDKL
ncbi:MAG: CMP-N,N'-diacetyllegionaminic acid synthase [Sphingobacteriales bacterium]|jgi:CMP-N,N'-diacetyllegionaminic acid synthase